MLLGKRGKSSNAEIDYVIQHTGQVVPIEVKSGSSGALKSLHVFMAEKKLRLAVRVNSDCPSEVDVGIGDAQSVSNKLCK